MPKNQPAYSCNHCGACHSKWSGQCANCGNWNSIQEDIQSSTVNFHGYTGKSGTLQEMSKVILAEESRFSSGLAELNRVLGGGIVKGSAILIGGDPGIGKSTLLLQVMAALSTDGKVIYISGEESLQQISLRANRLGIQENKLWLLAETRVEQILQHLLKECPKVVVIDSIQTMFTTLLSAAPGSVSQVRECAMQLVAYAKQNQTALFLVGHVTKEGNIAGPRVLEHMVDTVLYFEGETDSRYRMIRAFKNRFGAANELGIFAMTEKGLKEVSHPSALFLSRYDVPVTGSVITASREGSRPLLVELQALVDKACSQGAPRRITVGLDNQRLSMLLAVLHRHTGIALHSYDIFLNVVGGLQINETATDLAVILAILSSLKNKPIPHNFITFGEIGLAGEIRPISGGQDRIKEAQKHGFKLALIPSGNAQHQKLSEQFKIIAVKTLKEAVQQFDLIS